MSDPRGTRSLAQRKHLPTVGLRMGFLGGRPGQGPGRVWHNSLSVCLSVHASACSVALRASTPAPRCRGEKAIWRFLPFLSFPCSRRRKPGHTWHLGARVGPGRWGSVPRALRGPASCLGGPGRTMPHCLCRCKELPQDVEARAGDASYFGCRGRRAFACYQHFSQEKGQWAQPGG